MEDMSVTGVGLAQGSLSRPKTSKSGKIRINNPDNDRPLTIFLGIAAVFSILAILSLNVDWARMFSRLGNLAGVFMDLAKFDFSAMDLVWTSFAESVGVTVLATLYSLVIGLVLAAFMARNITPSKPLAAVLFGFCSFLRAVPTPVWVLMALATLGFGPAPGIVGLSIHATAFFARAFALAFEEVPTDLIEALQATGANRIQIFFSAVLPASLTALIAWGALRFEINFSESTILGMVGGGGIGYLIAASMSGYHLGRAGISILLVFLFAYSLELIFTAIKRKMKI